MNGQQIGITALVKSALTGEKANVSEKFDWKNALNTAKMHQIVPLIYYGITYSEIEAPKDIFAETENITYQCIAVNHNQLYELEKLYRAFEESGIEYMPLKGAVMKCLYPKPEMRTMGDADILIKPLQYEKIRRTMQGLGFREILESDHELVWDKKTIHIELHKRLIPSYNKDYYAYYGEGWSFARPENKSRFKLSDEDTFIYIFTHYAKHYRDGGIGIRHITDLYVFTTAHSELDYVYIEKELEKLQLLEFYKNTKHTLDVWFGGETPDNMSDFITAKIFGSGSYGAYDTRLLAVAVKTSGSDGNEVHVVLSILKNKAFPPYRFMVSRYKCLEKHPALLPLMWFVRFLQMPFFLHRGSIKRNVEETKITAPDKVIAYRDELEAVGLKYNFKE